MKKGDEAAALRKQALEIHHLVKVLENHIDKMEKAYEKRDHEEFNRLKKEVIMLQKKIHETAR